MDQEEKEALKYFLQKCIDRGKKGYTKTSPGCLVPTDYISSVGGDKELGKASDYINEKCRATHFYIENDFLTFDEYDAFGAGNPVKSNVLSVNRIDILDEVAEEDELFIPNLSVYVPGECSEILKAQSEKIELLEARVAKLEERLNGQHD
jgi:hypothetical protein